MSFERRVFIYFFKQIVKQNLKIVKQNYIKQMHNLMDCSETLAILMPEALTLAKIINKAFTKTGKYMVDWARYIAQCV